MEKNFNFKGFQEKILTRKGAMQFLQVGATKFNELRNDGIVNPIRIGRKTNYRLSDLLNAIDLLTVKTVLQ